VHFSERSTNTAALIKEEPDWKPVPAHLQRLLGHCLEKEPKNQLRDIGDRKRLLVQNEVLQELRFHGGAAQPPGVSRKGR